MSPSTSLFLSVPCRARCNTSLSSNSSLNSIQQSVIYHRQANNASETSQHVQHAGGSGLNQNTQYPGRSRRLEFDDQPKSKHYSKPGQSHHRLRRLDNHSVSREDQVSSLAGCEPSILLSITEGVDLPSIPSNQARPDIKSDFGETTWRARRADNPDRSNMHRPVHRDDYLLARGANPRTGVVTPGAYSTSSFIDQGELDQVRASAPRGRWQQRGEQWVSSDLGQVTPPRQRLPGSYPHKLRTPARLASGDLHSSIPESENRNHRQDPQHAAARKSKPDTSATFRLLKHSEGIDIYPEISFADVRSPPPLGEPSEALALRRKPVGSPSHKLSPDHRSAEGRSGRNDSDETVLRTPRFQIDLRCSSAPVPPRIRNITPLDKDKDLPTLPKDRDSSLLKEYQTIATQNPFLDPPRMAPPTDDPSSGTLNTCGPPPPEKDLPCLPMNNGQSQLTQEQTPDRRVAKEDQRVSPKTMPMPVMETPRGPRGGNPAYPFVRTARQTHPPAQTKMHQGPPGDKAMPIPIYDNPPKHQSPPMVRTSLTKADGPRAMPAPTARAPNRPSQVTNRSPLSTTTTSIDTTMTNAALRKRLQDGPWLSMTDPRIMNSGRPSMPRRPPPPPDASSIFMNTGMSMSTDTTMSVSLPRVRPRANNHPPVPVRAEGMYGFPRQAPSQNQSYATDTMFQRRKPVEIDNITIPESVDGQSDLIPPPLKPRLPSSQSRLILPDMSIAREEEVTSGLGLMRKCSRCHNGFVDVKRRNIDGAIRTSGHQKGDDKVSEGYNKSHPIGSPLPEVPEECTSGLDEAVSNLPTKAEESADAPDDDHPECCPDCCKEDCHEGCLGHPSPSTTSSPTKSIWSDMHSPSSASEMEDWEDNKSEASRKNGRAIPGLSISTQLSPRQDDFKQDNQRKAKIVGFDSANSPPVELSAQPRTPATPCKNNAVDHAGQALAAALSATKSASVIENSKEALSAASSATGSSQQKGSGISLHRRQRSSSSPAIAFVASSGKPSPIPIQRTSSFSRLRVPSPAGLAIGCSGFPKGRTVSGRAVTTLELPVPTLGAFAGGAMGEMALVPLEATKMWIKNHPQVLKVGWEVLERGWQMAQIMTLTSCRLWAVIFVYSKTGKLKFNGTKGETPGGFMVDCARSLLYLLLFAAVGAFFIRTLRIVLGVVGIVGWLFKAVFWVLKQVVGLGAVR